MNSLHIALIWGWNYDDKLACTHHTYFEATLRDMGVRFTRYTWPDWQVRMKPEWDFYFFIDFNDSLYQLNKYPQFHPRAYFVWDAFHVSMAYVGQVAEVFDIAYFAEKNVVDPLIAQGLDNIRWLPTAFYPGIYKSLTDIEKKYAFSFIGQPDATVVRKGKTRKEFFTELQSKYPSYVGQSVYGEEVNKIYNQSKILIDRTIWANMGTRTPEIIGSGGFSLINKGKIKTGLEKLAIDGVHYVSYDDSLSDCIEKMEYYLSNEKERNKIAQAGYKHFLANHTYKHRLQTILKDFGLKD
jgi:hypothetical protein